MGNYKYTDEEKKLNKAIKYNQDLSYALLNDGKMKKTREAADDALASSMELLASLGIKAEPEIKPSAVNEKLDIKYQAYEEIVQEAELLYDSDVELEDLRLLSGRCGY